MACSPTHGSLPSRIRSPQAALARHARLPAAALSQQAALLEAWPRATASPASSKAAVAIRIPPARSHPVLAALALGFASTPASAHLVSTGLGPLYDGITHFALTPEELLPMAALALPAGLRGPAHARLVVFTLALGVANGNPAAHAALSDRVRWRILRLYARLRDSYRR